MTINTFSILNERSKLILKQLVDYYVETGEPLGSETLSKKMGLKISSSTIRSIMYELQKEGFLYAPHKSSGRFPTDKGMRFFVDGLLEIGRLDDNEKNSIESQCRSKGESYSETLDKATKTLSGLSNCAGLVVAPKYQNNIKNIDFVELNNGKVDLVKKVNVQPTRRQDAPKVYDMNASIYIWRRNTLLNGNSLFSEKTCLYVMPEDRSVDIDTEFDWQFVEYLIQNKVSLI